MDKKNYTIYCLAKMHEYILDVQNFTEGEPSISQLLVDRKTKHAVNMCLEQIGELAVQIRNNGDPEFVSLLNIPVKEIIATRNRIVHGYGNIDYNIIENIIKEDIPSLKQIVEDNCPPEILEDPYLLYENPISFEEELEEEPEL